jgi:hypothetical protein
LRLISRPFQHSGYQGRFPDASGDRQMAKKIPYPINIPAIMTDTMVAQRAARIVGLGYIGSPFISWKIRYGVFRRAILPISPLFR